jgi:hypothetical protein
VWHQCTRPPTARPRGGSAKYSASSHSCWAWGWQPGNRWLSRGCNACFGWASVCAHAVLQPKWRQGSRRCGSARPGKLLWPRCHHAAAWLLGGPPRGTQVLDGVTPQVQFVKAVNDELVALMGEAGAKDLEPGRPMQVGRGLGGEGGPSRTETGPRTECSWQLAERVQRRGGLQRARGGRGGEKRGDGAHTARGAWA